MITPGTQFMAGLAAHLRRVVPQRLATDPAWRGLSVVLSDAAVPGEGEHKVVDYIRRQRTHPSYDPNTRHVLVGDDADLIMLGLATHEAHFAIVRTRRFTQQSPAQIEAAKQATAAEAAATGAPLLADPTTSDDPMAEWQLLHIPVVREYLRHEFAQYLRPEPSDFERLVDDFVFLCFFVGNDFLPHLPSLNVHEGALDLLIEVYCECVLGGDGSLAPDDEPAWLTDAGEVQMGAVRPLLANLGELEREILRRRLVKQDRETRPKNQTACIHFHRRGHCREGDRCAFLHGDICPLDQRNAKGKAALRSRLKRFQLDGTDPDGGEDSLTNGANTCSGELSLSPSLNAFERLQAHAVAGELGLGHESRGEGGARRIIVWRQQALIDEMATVKAKAASVGGMDTGAPAFIPGGAHEDTAGAAGAGTVTDRAVLSTRRDAAMLAELFSQHLSEQLLHADEEEAKRLDDGLRLGAGETWKGDYYAAKFGAAAVEAAAEASPAGGSGMDTSAQAFVPGVPLAPPPASTLAAAVAPPELLSEYLNGLCWVLRYYYRGLASWSWFYPFHYAPLASDLGPFVTSGFTPPAWELGSPLLPLEQLMGVFPAASSHCLPAACHELMSAPDSPILDFYPPTFKLDPNGQMRKWMWIAILPFIDEERLKAAVSERVYPTLTPDEHLQNELGSEVLYCCADSPAGQQIADALERGEQRMVALAAVDMHVLGKIHEPAVCGPEAPTILRSVYHAPAANEPICRLLPEALPPPTVLWTALVPSLRNDIRLQSR